MIDTAALIERLHHIELITQPHSLRAKSRDFYWYSPILKKALHHVCADLVVRPAATAEVIDVLKTCYAHDVPVTVRGAGTGNYGQAMPLKGGVVLDVSRMNRVLDVRDGAVRAEAGAIMAEIDVVSQDALGQELRFHPSTYQTASIGGYVAGGSSGIGSINHGLLRDPGNILAATVVTMEAEPRVLSLTGEDLQKVNHAYGTNGVMVDVTMPLTTAHPWVEMIVTFPTLPPMLAAAQALGENAAITKKLICALAAPIVHDYFQPFSALVSAQEHALLLMVARDDVEASTDALRQTGGKVVYRRDTAREALARGVQPLYEYSWNHTTLQALKHDRGLTYLQTLFPQPDNLGKIAAMAERFGDEVPLHLEFVRFDGAVTCFGLQLVRYTSDERLFEIIAAHEEAGCPVFNPHAYTLEEGGMKQIDPVQLAFKREADPKGLLNPGKMIGWDEPDYRGEPRFHLYPVIGENAMAEGA